MTKNFLEIDNVTFTASAQNKVSNVSFSIENQGDIICLLGPSGIGKTTILRTIAGLVKINYSIDEGAYLLGYSKFKTFKNIHVPYLKNSILLIGILLAIEIIKELPITLIMRPFNFETFATKAYIYASQDLLEAAAAPSLFLIIIASFFILITSKYILKD